jgi:FAD/FMN-containing dehydrogenase
MAADPHLTIDPDVRESYARDASGLHLVPTGVYRPTSEAEVVAALADARARGWPLTPAGLRSSTVGGPLAARGAVLSLERLDAVRDVDAARGLAVAGPGVVLAALKAAAQAAGAYYPPDPTSEEECTLGGTVATNASGARTLRWGPTRRWVRRLRVVLADGSVLDLRRRGAHRKSTAGYGPFQDPIDLFIGSEGTLGVVTEVEVALLPPPPPFFGAFAYFPDVAAALRFVAAARASALLAPRCLELFDATALAIVRPQSRGVAVPAAATALVFFEADREGPGAAPLEAWQETLAAAGALVAATVVAEDAARQRELRRLRHLVPTTLNEWGAAHAAAGGRKVSTDCAVPPERLPELFAAADRLTAAAGVDLVVRYGHVGDGHPHIYMRGRDTAEVERLSDVAAALCAEALRLGGTVAAEHGVGKVKQRFLALQYPPPVLAAMRAVKRGFDPDGLLAPGNIFPP